MIEAGPTVELLHVDAALVVAIKPAGLLAVQGRSEPDCLAARVQARYPDACVVHRLDMATSGLMLFARGAAAQRTLNRAFAERRVAKGYVAVVEGRPEPPDGAIALPLAADWPNRPRQRVDLAAGKPSLTHYRTVAFDPADRLARLELEPVTGRAHQLRVHLAAIGHPILGDALYAPDAPPRATRLLLHAAQLAFDHPASRVPLSFTSAAPF